MPPKSPNPDFDFMLKNQPPAKRGLPLPSLNLPRPVKIAFWAVVGIIFVIIISSIINGHKSGSQVDFGSVLARGQETLRVTILVQQLQLQDPQTQALAATVSNSLASDQVQLKNYLSRNHIKVSAAQIVADLDKSTDSSMKNAQQNNNLDGAYASYLKGALAKYEQDLQAAYKSAGPNGKSLLSSSFDSAQTLLSAPPLKV